MSELTVGTLSGLAANGYVIDVASGSKLVQPGSVLQVVSTTKTDTFTTTSGTYVDITGLTASITPTSTSSKVLVLATVHASLTLPGSAAHQAQFVFSSAGSNAIGDAAGSRTRAMFALKTGGAFAPADSNVPLSMNYLDAPATTSAISYQLQAKVSQDSGSGALLGINRSYNDSDNSTYGRTISTITLMEIAG